MQISSPQPAHNNAIQIPVAKPPGNSNNAEIGAEAYELPSVDDLFDGSKANFSPIYDKYIAATQVPFAPDSTYYDETADKQAANAFYGDVGALSGEKRTSALRDLVTKNHTPEPKGYDYNIAKNLYTIVDRHPDGSIKDVYTKEPIKVFNYPDISFDTLSENDLSAIAGAMTSSPEVIASWLGFQRGKANLNCEHVVPQSWYNKAEPMRSDLHHLYACDIKTNSQRGNTPFGGYTPQGGKGEVARATLYFMLRYPDIKLPYNAQKVEMIKEWSQSDPPDTHEKHRNAEIEKIQGNRNPFIDNPEWLKDFKP